jgi:hypothetical protein
MQYVVACKNVSPLLVPSLTELEQNVSPLIVPSLTELEHPERMTDPAIQG